MNYPTYTKIYQVCFLLGKDLDASEELFNRVNRAHHGVITCVKLNKMADWCSEMDKIINNCKNNNETPILHIDMHGSDEGYGKDSIEIISWDFLIPSILKLNEACNGQLFLSLNVCEGLNIYHHLSNNHCPLSFITLGAFDDILATYGRDAFSQMYIEYYTNHDMNKAIEAFYKTPAYRQTAPMVLV